LPRFDAVLFDLLTALLASDQLWGEVADDAELGRSWRQASLKLVTGSNEYQPYESLVARSALQMGLSEQHAAQVLARWDELRPWPGVPEVLDRLAGRVPLGIVTNCTQDLAERGARRTGVEYATIVSAERAGWYKPAVQPYLMGIADLGLPPDRVLFVAGSVHDIGGAHTAGMPVYWHNHYGQSLPAGAPPLANERDLGKLAGIVLEE
jgi:2-haloalkanoic acid dehalogenase type II